MCTCHREKGERGGREGGEREGERERERRERQSHKVWLKDSRRKRSRESERGRFKDNKREIEVVLWKITEKEDREKIKTENNNTIQPMYKYSH